MSAKDQVADEALDRLARAIIETVNISRSVIPAVDIADMQLLHFQGGLAAFGEGEASGEGRAVRAAEAALADLSDQIRKARGS